MTRTRIDPLSRCIRDGRDDDRGAGVTCTGGTIGAADEILCSAIALWATARAVAKVRTVPIPLASSEIESFVADFAIRLVPIAAAESRVAVEAYHRYGKGTGHPAKLNMGDCFAYACAKTNAATLLYKGDDFLHTDLA